MAGAATTCSLLCHVVIALLLQFGRASDWNTLPRKTVTHDVLREARRFSRPRVFNYTSLHLDEDAEVLYVGAREAIFALWMEDVTVEVKEAIVWSAPTEKKKDCVQKGKNNQVGALSDVRWYCGRFVSRVQGAQ